MGGLQPPRFAPPSGHPNGNTPPRGHPGSGNAPPRGHPGSVNAPPPGHPGNVNAPRPGYQQPPMGFRPQPPAGFRPQPPAQQQQQLPMAPAMPMSLPGAGPRPQRGPPPPSYQPGPPHPQMVMGGGAPMGGGPRHPPLFSGREHAIASAVAAAAAAAEAKAAAEYDATEMQRVTDAKNAARKRADESADAVDAQLVVCEEAEMALRQARIKLGELEHAKAQAFVGLPMTESGVAARWNSHKGFGFIVPRGGGTDLFCHCHDILDGTQLKEGSSVRFTRVFDERKQKYRAAEVTGGAPEPGDAESAGGNNGQGQHEAEPAEERGRDANDGHDGRAEQRGSKRAR